MVKKADVSEMEVHLLAIRKALVNRNAAVMVGSGFSRNAEGGENLATWRQLSDALVAELEPGRQPSGTFSPAATSQLAEQYSRVFSPSHLEQLIKRCVPDDQVTPGALHEALLTLPWSEVFTTNYDTLLERAADKLFEVSYFTVCSREDIPQSKVLNRRRIVKLHGSFPSHRPFIFTEEHYRTYPEKFAPFVNLVRQSLLENVFCLIGFSGDDPNFLHWLGWVRDMLDKQALPVYLLLGDEPTLGERKLYEARGVVPVVLPLASNGDRSDYQARYWQFFNELKKPLADTPLDWGKFSDSFDHAHTDSKDEKFERFLKRLPSLAEYRLTYPGWVVAPNVIRNRFRSSVGWLEENLHQAWVRERLAKLPVALVLAIFELYCWVQQILLGPLDDNIAGVGCNIILAENAESINVLPDEMALLLSRMGVANSDSLRKTWIQAAISSLVWARQSHRVVQYNELRKQLQVLSKQDSVIKDQLIYEEALRCLQNADRITALDIVGKWNSKSSDAYVQVLKASLLAEAGDPIAAISLCEQAIQALRRQQRSRPDDPALISKEAWACLIASLIQGAVDFHERFYKSEPEENSEDKDEQNGKENFNDRVDALGARGYSARDELHTAIAKLNAEAEPPTKDKQYRTNFDLGSISATRRLGFSSDLREKIGASFAWLELIERVGLMPYARSGTFYAEEMLQAAWWARFADRQERSIGLLLRANVQDSLKPYDSALPPHRTGWLNRYEVARVSEETIVDLTAELIRLMVAEFEGLRSTAGMSHRTAFVIEVFGRIVIRVRDESLLLRWGQQLLEIHRTVAFQSEPAVWQPMCGALTRVLEALPSLAQERLLFLIFQLPLVPFTNNYHQHELGKWANLLELSKFFASESGRNGSLDWDSIAQDLLSKLRASRNEEPSWLIWNRLEVLRQAALLTDEQTQEAGRLLWQTAKNGQWPVIPQAAPAATLNWPAPSGDVSTQFLDRLLGIPFLPFNSGYMELVPQHKRRSYHLGGAQRALSQRLFAFRLKNPSLVQMGNFIDRINEWVELEQADLLGDIGLHDELYQETELIIDYLDELLALCVEQLSQGKKGGHAARMRIRILALDEKLQNFPFERLKLHLALMKSGDRGAEDLNKVSRSIVCAMSSDSRRTSSQTINATTTLLSDMRASSRDAIQPIFDATVACMYTRRMPSLPDALDILTQLSKDSWSHWLDNKSLLFLDVALDDLAIQLAYGSSSRDASISDESVPLLRFKTMRLAFALVEVAGVESLAARKWLESASADPLPEIRLERFQFTK